MQAEADYLRNLAEPHLSPSNIESPGSAAEQQFHRNSYTTWAPPKFGDRQAFFPDPFLAIPSLP